ncbi:hypothetical protein I5H01_gp045 [Mycobacterium phage MarkPhew]|uniref:Uncharacterized protein n=1 Tax=Mycobacterium phage MarkPhew TaxID=2725625 RepID=A0A6M3SZD9_9CAUD|nr:hypothetical protein I5H01_gp045 [Mycobacterium phage MarkPhew]QJD50362.1 hypothetical protein SEA_MARKPHEW_62 [Mycobacterium phage MarkPhew]
MSNFAQVGKVVVRNAQIGNQGIRDVEVIVGVRADLGQVVVQADGRTSNPVPGLRADEAAALGALLTNAASAAGELAAAYRAYQDALQAAEDKLAAAMNGGGQ